jgi:hypothetical protein
MYHTICIWFMVIWRLSRYWPPFVHSRASPTQNIYDSRLPTAGVCVKAHFQNMGNACLCVGDCRPLTPTLLTKGAYGYCGEGRRSINCGVRVLYRNVVKASIVINPSMTRHNKDAAIDHPDRRERLSHVIETIRVAVLASMIRCAEQPSLSFFLLHLLWVGGQIVLMLFQIRSPCASMLVSPPSVCISRITLHSQMVSLNPPGPGIAIIFTLERASMGFAPSNKYPVRYKHSDARPAIA